MADYGGLYGDIQKRLPAFTFTTTSKPAQADLTAWIDAAEALINNALKAGGISTPVTNGEGVEQMKELSLDYAEGRARRALSIPGTDNDADGQRLIAAFYAVIEDMKKQPAMWSAMLGGGDAEPETTRIRSHVTNDVDGRASTHADFAPTFTKAAAGDQF